MEQPGDQQLVILSDQLLYSGYCGFSDRGVSEPSWHVSGWSCSFSCLHGLGVGRRKQEFHQELQEEKPYPVCHRCHGNKLLSALAVWWSDGVHLWNYFPLAFDPGPCFSEAAQCEEQAGEQNRGSRYEEVPNGSNLGSAGPTGGESQQDPGLPGVKAKQVVSGKNRHEMCTLILTKFNMVCFFAPKINLLFSLHITSVVLYSTIL